MLKLFRFSFITLFVIYTNQVQAMGFLDFMRVYIFSEVDGVVLMNGKPVSGAKVIRTADYKDKIHTNTVVTDNQGRFHFDDIFTYSMRLSETAILQKIKIYYEGEEYLAWKLLKKHDSRYGELNDPDKPIESIQKLNLICELTDNQDKEQFIGSDLRRRIIYGLCNLD
jgi:uncharacterized protein DUF6795